MNYYHQLGILALSAVVITGCQADKDGLSEKAAIEGRVGSQATVQAENANLAARAAAMEVDLERRRRFIDSVIGTYEGTISYSQSGDGAVRFIISSSFPRQPTSNRSRSIEELSYELTNLYLNIQVVEWSSVNDGGELAFGCTFTHVRPNITDGVLHLIADDCKMSYELLATEFNPESRLQEPTQDNRDVSRLMASDVVEGRLIDIPAFMGRKQSNLSSMRRPLRVRKVE